MKNQTIEIKAMRITKRDSERSTPATVMGVLVYSHEHGAGDDVELFSVVVVLPLVVDGDDDGDDSDDVKDEPVCVVVVVVVVVEVMRVVRL